MRTITRILILILVFTALVPIKLGVQCLFSPSDALAFFNIPLNDPGLITEKLLIVLGGYVLAMVTVQILAIVWLIQKKPAGFTLSFLLGILSIGRGLIIMGLFGLGDSLEMRISLSPIVFGILIMVFSLVARKATEPEEEEEVS